MKSQFSAFKHSSIACLLSVSMFLSSGCESVKQETLDKTNIPDVKNITEATDRSEITDSVETTKYAELFEERPESTGPSVETTSELTNRFETYISQNDDFMGWLKINGTNIDEPIVQGEDNAHYLEYDHTGAKNYSGAVFLDYKNQGNFYDNHMSLYAHYMEDGTMTLVTCTYEFENARLLIHAYQK